MRRNSMLMLINTPLDPPHGLIPEEQHKKNNDLKLSVAICNLLGSVTVGYVPSGRFVIYDSSSRKPLAVFSSPTSLLYGIVTLKRKFGWKIPSVFDINNFIKEQPAYPRYYNKIFRELGIDKKRFSKIFTKDFYERPVQDYPTFKNLTSPPNH